MNQANHSPAPGNTVRAFGELTSTLPEGYAALIGQAMIEWALLEMRLQELAFLALGVTDAQGRLAVKSMRAKDLALLAEELLNLAGESIPWESDADGLRVLEERRNLLAHGVWLKHGDEFLLRDLTGTISVNGTKMKKKVQPAGIPITLSALENLVQQVQQAISDTKHATLALLAQRKASR